MKKKILLIGGSSKVGSKLIEKLDQKEFQIYSTYFKKKISSKKNNLKQFKLNLAKTENLSKFVKLIKDDLSIIIFLSGILKGKSLKQFNDKEIYENFKINFISQIVLLRNIVKKQKKNCLVIFLSSISGRRGSYDPIYASAKGSMISFIKSISKWEAPKVKCIGLCPGLIKDTKMYKTFKKDRLKKLLVQNPNKEFLNTEDLAEIICDIIKPHWRHANGSIIDINGGIF